jgi:hypothetical protein
VHHHPLILTGLAWWALLGFTVKLDASALVVGFAPTLAVIVGYYLAKRTAKQIARDSAVKVQEVHTIVNNQADTYRTEISALKTEINGLREQIALLTPKPGPAT